MLHQLMMPDGYWIDADGWMDRCGRMDAYRIYQPLKLSTTYLCIIFFGCCSPGQIINLNLFSEAMPPVPFHEVELLFCLLILITKTNYTLNATPILKFSLTSHAYYIGKVHRASLISLPAVPPLTPNAWCDDDC